MRNTRSGCLFLVVLLAIPFESALAKLETAKLSISGPGIFRSVETREPAAIAPSVWGGQFASWNDVAKEPQPTLPRYTVKFHVKTGPETTRMAYVVYYVWDPDAERAYVYVPGPGDEWYGLNASAILRDGSDGRTWRDGHWYCASEQWSRIIQELLDDEVSAVHL